MLKLLNERRIAQMVAWKLLGQTSCAKCKFLYLQDRGYSNWTVEHTSVRCALDRNPNLDDWPDMPHDWNYDGKDNWSRTRDSRCELYEAVDVNVHLDVDGENYPDEFGLDKEAVTAIEQHSGRWREQLI